MLSTLERKVGTIFIPVKNVEDARDWYCNLLGVTTDGEIQFGHIYVIPLENGIDLVLDSKIFDKRYTGTAPLFHFNTKNIQQTYEEFKENGIELITEVEHDHWFNFKDPDENVLMVCQC
ncbi:VOC family protein [Alteribacter populi]|uniref:VOC family protein n=1 Tax=Alteribacter populi TaxID=2011011 RepID=UPI000BBB46EA|nr:VOC family protein [Alteribacter populi]